MRPPFFSALPSHRSSREASAMLISLWALLVLSAAVFAWVRFLEQGIGQAREANLTLEAKALAHSGLAIALNEKVTRQTPLLVASMGQDRGYKVEMQGEGGRLNLNYLLLNEEPARLDFLKAYLARRGISLADSARLIDGMLDWIDDDSIKHLNGAEETPDYHPPNRGLLISLNEIPKIKGSGPLVSQGGWQNDFTLFTSPGLIDLQSASVDVLSSLPGVGEARARRFIQIRQGPDKTDGTLDDRVFKDLPEALGQLGVSGSQSEQLSGLVTLNDPTMHIISIGQAGKVYRQAEVVARKVGGNPLILSWTEK